MSSAEILPSMLSIKLLFSVIHCSRLILQTDKLGHRVTIHFQYHLTIGKQSVYKAIYKYLLHKKCDSDT